MHVSEGQDVEWSSGEVESAIAAAIGRAINDEAELTDDPAWERAWEEDIRRPGAPLSRFGTMGPHEGWTEFIRLLAFEPDFAEKNFPACWRFLGDHRLLKESEETPEPGKDKKRYSALVEVFAVERIDA